MIRQYSNLLGMVNAYRDNQLRSRAATSPTGNVTVLGWAPWGPVNEPVTGTQLSDLRDVFGSTTGTYGQTGITRYNNNELMDLAGQAFQSGGKSVTGIRLDFGAVNGRSTFLLATDITGAAASGAIVNSKLVLTYGTLPVGVTVGMAGWFQLTDSETSAVTVSAVYTVSAINTTAKTITFAETASSVPTGGGTATWQFATGFSLVGFYPGAAISGVTVTCTGTSPKTLVITTPVEFGGQTFTYRSSNYATVADLARKINYDLFEVLMMIPAYGSDGTEPMTDLPILVDNSGSTDVAVTIGVAPTNVFKDAPYSGTGTPMTVVTAGTNGSIATTLTGAAKRAAYAAALGNPLNDAHDEKALALIRGQQLGVIVTGLHFDDLIDSNGFIYNFSTEGTTADTWVEASETSDASGANCLQYLLDFANLQHVDGITTEIAMDFSPLVDTTLTARKQRATLAAANCFMLGELKNDSAYVERPEDNDAGKYLNAIFGQGTAFHPELGGRETGLAPQYAALLAILPGQEAPSKKTLQGCRASTVLYFNKTINALSGPQGTQATGGAYVCFEASNGQLIVANAQTAAKAASDYSDKQNFRAAALTNAMITFCMKPFLGQPFGLTQRMAAETAIRTGMDSLSDAGMLNGREGQGYIFTIGDFDNTGASLNRIDIDVQIRPTQVLKWINQRIGLRR